MIRMDRFLALVALADPGLKPVVEIAPVEPSAPEKRARKDRYSGEELRRLSAERGCGSRKRTLKETL